MSTDVKGRNLLEMRKCLGFLALGCLNRHMPRTACHLQSGFLSPCTRQSWLGVSKNYWVILFLNGESLCVSILFSIFWGCWVCSVVFLQLWGAETSFKWQLKLLTWSFEKSNKYHWTLWYHNKKNEQRVVMLGSGSYPFEDSTHLNLKGLRYAMDLGKCIKHFRCWGLFIIKTKLCFSTGGVSF